MESDMPASLIGAVTAQLWQEGADASVLPQAYQDLLDVAAGAGRTLRAAEFAAARYISCPFVRIACRSGPGI